MHLRVKTVQLADIPIQYNIFFELKKPYNLPIFGLRNKQGIAAIFAALLILYILFLLRPFYNSRRKLRTLYILTQLLYRAA